jgi:hypothetical protein
MTDVDVLRAEVAALREELGRLRTQLATEVRTRKVVVVGPDGFERIELNALADTGEVVVNGRTEAEPSVIIGAGEENDPCDAYLMLKAGEHLLTTITAQGSDGLDPPFARMLMTYYASEEDAGTDRLHELMLDHGGLDLFAKHGVARHALFLPQRWE